MKTLPGDWPSPPDVSEKEADRSAGPPALRGSLVYRRSLPQPRETPFEEPPWPSEAPDREAQQIQRLRQDAQLLAARHTDAELGKGLRLAERIDELARFLEAAATAGRLDQTRFLKNEWHAAEESLPREAATLPELISGPAEGLPRVYELVREFLRLAEGPCEGRMLREFVDAYQSQTPLCLAELWAVPAMLRLGLLEAIAREVLADPDQDPTAPRAPLQRILARLHALAELDWNPLVEELSVIDRRLRQDPAEVYAAMEFESREGYRGAVAELARRSPLSEEEIAQRVLELAQASAGRSLQIPAAHVGYYLLGPGRAALEERIAYRRRWRETVVGSVLRAPLAFYLGAIALVWLLLTVAAAVAAAWNGVPIGWRSGLLLLLFAGAASELAVRLVNWLVGRFVPPRPIARLDYSRGIPETQRTLVAVPTILSSPAGVRKLVEQLETCYLANRDPNLWFALLSDWADASEETLPEDHALLELAESEIRRLNACYTGAQTPLFFLLHRPRRYNAQEGVWMGEERKRGKLAGLNRLLQTGATDAFCRIVGEVVRLRSVRYVLTLDSDTMLPRDAARKLVGCLAHPLHRPQWDPTTRRVVSGYGVLQPRVATTLREAMRSGYSRLFAGEAGIDPYTNQTSDVYQDLFAQGSFIGKGIYEVETFETALAGRFPENRVLSHDLIEGAFAGSGLASDVLLVEGFPATFLADMSRRHRWIRGDWQIAEWLAPRVPAAEGRVPNPLSGLARWKIFDNLRRSLVPVFLLGMLVLGWVATPASAWGWTLWTLVLVFGPLVPTALAGLWGKPEATPWRLHLRAQGQSFAKSLLREAVSLCFLPYTVHCHLDAMVRTLRRLYVSHRRLLEWTTSSDAEVRAQGNCRDHYEVMWACPATAQAVAAVLAIVAPWVLVPAAPLLLGWLFGPLLAWRLSQPMTGTRATLSATQRTHFRRWARQTWHFFESQATTEHHGLPPDSIREPEAWKADPRTSATNIGMGLLANLAAYDLGYLPLGRLLERTRLALDTLSRLERHRGHFFNWYDLRTLKPLEPRYVSTVDSGNLWAALVVLRGGLRELAERPMIPAHLREGICDTVAVLVSLRARTALTTPASAFDTQLAILRRLCQERPSYGLDEFLHRAERAARTLLEAAPPSDPALEEWCLALVRQTRAACRDNQRHLFWRQLPPLSAPFHATIAGWACQLQELHACLTRLDQGCTLQQLPGAAEEVIERVEALLTALEQANGDGVIQAFRHDLRRLAEAAAAASDVAREESAELGRLAAQCEELAEMDFRFLYHPQRRQLSIGYNATARRRDRSYYDLLASESRLTSFLAVAAGQLPQEHWSGLGRPMTLLEGQPALLSWSGSMFEYLMPMLFLPTPPATVLERSCRAAVVHQIRHAREQGIPWGISESCFAAPDGYGYRAFGVPGLALEPGLDEHRVIAPYASALAAMVTPEAACANLAALEAAGHLSPYGFYEALDYTPERCPADGRPATCRLVMAHHSGMTLLALVHLLAEQPMQRRFLADPRCRAHELLLEERLPQAIRPVNPAPRSTGKRLTS